MKRLPDALAVSATNAKCVVPLLAENLSSATGFLFIGRGTAIPYASEGALKLKELTYRWAEHYPGGELKHGPLALIGSGTPVVALHSADPKLAVNIAEVEARGGHVISVGPPGSTISVGGNLAAPWGPLESVIPLQMLARTLGLALGWDVDKPRNLAKSVTVE
jgi:glucosamine--fructose-6-phosphate aminotransferase (isomerizing)